MKERALLHQLRAGKQEALTALFKRFNRPLLYFSMQMLSCRETAEEIVSDAFIKIWEHRARFESIENLKAFLYIVTKNACINYAKTPYAKRQFVPVEICEDELWQDTDILLKIVHSELMEAVFAEVNRLPDKQREVFRMSFLEDLSTEEISEKLSMSTAAVYTNRSRAIALLRTSIDFADPVILLLILKCWDAGGN